MVVVVYLKLLNVGLCWGRSGYQTVHAEAQQKVKLFISASFSSCRFAISTSYSMFGRAAHLSLACLPLRIDDYNA